MMLRAALVSLLAGTVIGSNARRQLWLEELERKEIAPAFQNTSPVGHFVSLKWEYEKCEPGSNRLHYMLYRDGKLAGCQACALESEISASDPSLTGFACPANFHCYAVSSGRVDSNNRPIADFQRCSPLEWRPEDQVDGIYFDSYCDSLGPNYVLASFWDRDCKCVEKGSYEHMNSISCEPEDGQTTTFPRTCNVDRSMDVSYCGPQYCQPGTNWTYFSWGYGCAAGPTPSRLARRNTIDGRRERSWLQ